MYAVIRVRGHSKIKHDAVWTLRQLRLHRVNHLVLVPETDTFRHMLQVVKDYVTWGEIDDATLRLLLSRAAELQGGRALDEATASSALEALMSGRKLSDLHIKEVIRLHPPRRGWEAVKKPYASGGSLGYRGSHINELITRMIPGDVHGEQNK
jgi:large subunit ribosomal protein L30